MTILREGVDTGIGTRAMRRPGRRAGELLACQLLGPAFLRAFSDSRLSACTEPATREFGRSAAPILCGYAVRAISTPGLALLAMRQPRGRAMVAAAIDCLAAKEDLDDC